MSLRCEIISQDRLVFQGEVESVSLPGAEGDMGVLPHHAPLLALLRPGILMIRRQGEEVYFTVMGGMAEIGPESVRVFADAAENMEEIDVERAEAARQRALARLAPEALLDSNTYLIMRAALRRANLRLGAVKRYRRSSIKPRRTSHRG